MIKYLKNEVDFYSSITKNVMVDFYAEWCAPCQLLSTNLEKLDVDILKVDIDEFSEIAIQFGVTSVPTIITFKNNKVNAFKVGYQDMEELGKLCKDLK